MLYELFYLTCIEQREDGEAVYAVTPFMMLTFIRQPARLIYGRRLSDRMAVVASASALLLLCCFTVWHYRKALAGSVRGGLTPAKDGRMEPLGGEIRT